MDEDRSDGFGRRLRRLREAAGLTQEQLAERAGLSANAVGVLERGERQRPYPHTIRALAAALGLSDEERSALARAVPGDRDSAAPEQRPAAALTAPPTRLVGRERELAALVERLTRSAARLVTLTGPGGVGKTRLSLQAAAEVADYFPDGVTVVSLAPLADPALVVPAIAAALGLREPAGGDLGAALRTFLRARRLLLVLDNVEHVLAAAPAVADLLAAGAGLTVLATSRAPLRLRGEQEVPVEPLALPDLTRVPAVEEVAASPAARLFVERVREAQPGFELSPINAAAVAAICRRVDGLPLAIELAAAWVKVLPPTALLARLDPALPLLAGGARDLPERQRTMQRAVAWSYALLDPSARDLFGRLSVFVGGFTLEAAEAVAGPGDDGPAPSGGGSILETVASLVDQNLLRRDEWAPAGGQPEPRFGMLETVREFALGRLEASDDADAVRRRHAAWCVALAERAEAAFLSAEERVWLDRLEAEHDNLRAALTWAIGRREAATALRLAGAPWWFWAMRGFLGEGHSWLAQALALPDGERGGPRATAVTVAGMVAWARGEVDRADDLLRESAGLWRSLGDGARLARSLHYLGLVAWQRGDFRAMAARAEESLAAAEAAGDEVGTAIARVTLGGALLRLGENDRARLALERALERFEALCMRRGSAWALTHLGEVAEVAGERRRAFGLHLRALAVYQELEDAWGIGEEVPPLAALAAASGHHEAAARLLGAAARLRERTGIAPQNRLADPTRVAAELKERLGEPAFAAAWESGRALAVDGIVAEAEAIAAEPAVPTRPAPARPALPAGLTEREAEVLRLVAQGLTNPQVAERLYLSPRTIDAHLHRIYAKLDVPNRGAAIRFAVHHGLA